MKTCPKCRTSFKDLPNLEDHRTDEESECYLFQKETVYKGNTAAKPEHTPTPYCVGDFDGTENNVYDMEAGDLVAECRNPQDSAYIVRAVNAHEELLGLVKDLAKFSPVSFEQRAHKAIAKAEGNNAGREHSSGKGK